MLYCSGLCVCLVCFMFDGCGNWLKKVLEKFGGESWNA